MELPSEDPDDWTYDTVLALVEQRTGEPGWFDFKAVLNDTAQRAPHNRHIQKAACAMANTDGGFLVFGVLDAQENLAPHGGARIVGVLHDGEFGKHLGDKLEAITPPIAFQVRRSPISLPSDPDRGIVPVRIPASALAHAVIEQGQPPAFYRRGDGGTAALMNYYEVRDRMLYAGERLRKVRLLRLEIAEYRQQAELLLRLLNGGRQDEVPAILLRFDTTDFRPLLADVCGLLPPSDELLRELMGLVGQANLLNRWLERSSPDPTVWQPSTIAGFRAGAETTAHDLLQACARVGAALDEQFGSLIPQLGPS